MSAQKATKAIRKAGTVSTPAALFVPEKLATLVQYFCHEKVILDANLAELYVVATKALNQAVQRNLERFPTDFMFELTENEAANLRSQFVTSKYAKDLRHPARHLPRHHRLSTATNMKRHRPNLEIEGFTPFTSRNVSLRGLDPETAYFEL